MNWRNIRLQISFFWSFALAALAFETSHTFVALVALATPFMGLLFWILQSFIFVRSYRKPRLYLVDEFDRDDITDKSFIVSFCRRRARRYERIRGLESIQLAAHRSADRQDTAYVFAPICRLNRTLAEDTDLNLCTLRIMLDLNLLPRTLLVMPVAINAGLTGRVAATWAQMRYELSLTGLLLPPFAKEKGVVLFSSEDKKIVISDTVKAEGFPLLQIDAVEMLDQALGKLIGSGTLQLLPPEKKSALYV